MQRTDTRTFLTIFYLLIVVFLAVLYFQKGMLTSPESLATVEAISQSSPGEYPVFLPQNFNFSGENMLIILVAATIFYASARVLEHSRN